MGKMIGYCGIVCSDCPVLVATRENDDSAKRRIAQVFTAQYKNEYKPSDINCDGCQSDGSKVFSYCNICEIRKCGKEKQIENCAHCDDYPCEKLSKVFSGYPKAKETLDSIRNST
jgi:hypothetical protein